MKILIVCDKFKGSLDAATVCKSIAVGIKANNKNKGIHCIIQPVADGGDGTLAILQSLLKLDTITVETIDPLNRKIKANYLSDGSTAYIELAFASGMVHLTKGELNVLKTTTVGTGLLLKHALQNKHKQIVLSLGGSCTNDVGLGIAHTLGFQFLNNNRQSIIPCGGNLHSIKKINKPKNPVEAKFRILCDVDNPLYGINGAAHVFAKQKGATQKEILQLDDSMQQLSKLLENHRGKSISTLKGGGAAGGIAAGLYALLNDVIIGNGFDYLSQLIDLENVIANSDLVITGEGKLDLQSLGGKVVGKIASICKKHNILLIAITGSNALSQPEMEAAYISEVYAIMDYAKSLEDAIENGEKYIGEISRIIDFNLLQL